MISKTIIFRTTGSRRKKIFPAVLAELVVDEMRCRAIRHGRVSSSCLSREAITARFRPLALAVARKWRHSKVCTQVQLFLAMKGMLVGAKLLQMCYFCLSCRQFWFRFGRRPSSLRRSGVSKMCDEPKPGKPVFATKQLNSCKIFHLQSLRLC